MKEATFNAIGESLTRALLTGEFDLYREVMDLPITFAPRGAAAYTLKDIDALKADFELYHMSIKARHLTDIYRKVLNIQEAENGRFDVTVEMHLLASAERVADPFESIMTLHKPAENWRFCHIRSSLQHIKWTLGETDL